METFFTIKQTADKLQVSRQYIWLLIKLEKLHAVKIGGRYLIEQNEVVKLFKKRIGGKNG